MFPRFYLWLSALAIKRANPNTLRVLDAEILSSDDHRYCVTLTRNFSLTPEVPGVEFVRLVMHAYAKTMYSLPEYEDGIRARDWLRDVGDRLTKNLTADDLFIAADIADVAGTAARHVVLRKRPRVTLIRLLFMSQTVRHVATMFPTDGSLQQFVFGFVALTEAAKKEMTLEEIGILARGIHTMNSIYASGTDPGDLASATSVPNAAYLNAAMR